MVKTLRFFIVIDWGFTRLKLWGLDHNKKIIKSKFVYIKEINPTPQFYLYKSIKDIASVLENFINQLDLKEKEIHILSSCQMHCIAGLADQKEIFISTWNDLPTSTKNRKIQIINGQPSLKSMPVNKIMQQNGYYLLNTEYLKNFYDREYLQINFFMTPLQLVFNFFFNMDLEISNSLWESTCLPENLKKYSVKQNLLFKNKKQTNRNLSLSKNLVKFYPELGDLQASTFSSLEKTDIVLNLGTGSQVICKLNDKNFKPKFFRNFPLYGNLSVISHIPCGRVFSEYCKYKRITFDQLLYNVEKLDIKTYKDITRSKINSLLFFPGFNIISYEYTNKPLISIYDLIKYTPFELISYWIYQYIIVINKECKNNNTIKISISGELGGISRKILPLFNKIYDDKYTFNLTNKSLPESLLKCYQL